MRLHRLRDENGYLVAATAGGARTNPQWILNLGAARKAHVQIGEDQFDADARLIEGGERDQLWQDVVVAQAPQLREIRGEVRANYPRRPPHPTAVRGCSEV
jgi:deazaflavin-dependent oxidoreductase (nitroreductase family)